jgi:hypothetical protein
MGFRRLLLACARVSRGRRARRSVAERDHPSAHRAVPRPVDRARGRGAGGAPRDRARHARGLVDPTKEIVQRDERREDADRRLRRAERGPRGVGGLLHPDRRRRRRDGAGDEHGRRASGRRRRSAGDREEETSAEKAENDLAAFVRTIARAPRPQRRARGEGRARVRVLHRGRGARRRSIDLVARIAPTAREARRRTSGASTGASRAADAGRVRELEKSFLQRTSARCSIPSSCSSSSASASWASTSRSRTPG